MLGDLRRFAVSRSLFPPTTLGEAVRRPGFVQADPIRAPARAQDLTLRHRVNDYLAGDLERQYSQLDVEEDVGRLSFEDSGGIGVDLCLNMKWWRRRERPTYGG